MMCNELNVNSLVYFPLEYFFTLDTSITLFEQLSQLFLSFVCYLSLSSRRKKNYKTKNINKNFCCLFFCGEFIE